jgi:hypothetical protein
MRMGQPLEIPGAVSPRILERMNQIQGYFRRVDPKLVNIPVVAQCRNEDQEWRHGSKRTALFFSLGVDSFYTLLRDHVRTGDAHEAISDLIVVRGFDVALGERNTRFFGQVLENCELVAMELNKNLVPVATNLREFGDRFMEWNLYFGSALASVALILERMFNRVHIASSGYPESIQGIAGSDLFLDPLWSTERSIFVHSDPSVKRIDKIRFISQFPLAMKTLRVCYSNPNNEYNCGRCEKCLRTMILLDICESLGKCLTLPHRINLRLLSEFRADTPIQKSTFTGLTNALGSSELDPVIGEILARRVHATSPGKIIRSLFWRIRKRVMTYRLYWIMPFLDKCAWFIHVSHLRKAK